jgi:hypothetical protein
MTDPESDPEDVVSTDTHELREHEADVVDEFDRPLPADADEADVYEQKRALPEDDDGYDR